jgi:hypothetical protein
MSGKYTHIAADNISFSSYFLAEGVLGDEGQTFNVKQKTTRMLRKIR